MSSVLIEPSPLGSSAEHFFQRMVDDVSPTSKSRFVATLSSSWDLMDDAPDAAARERGVAVAARDEVAVEVHDGLACRLAAIHPHVVAVRLVALLDPGFRQVQNRRQRLLLSWCHP